MSIAKVNEFTKNIAVLDYLVNIFTKISVFIIYIFSSL